MVGLQEMLLQPPADRLLILPAWPLAWDVNFKLHAPNNTTVECEVRNGKIVNLDVDPPAHKKECGGRRAVRARPAAALKRVPSESVKPIEVLLETGKQDYHIVNPRHVSFQRLDVGCRC